MSLYSYRSNATFTSVSVPERKDTTPQNLHNSFTTLYFIRTHTNIRRTIFSSSKAFSIELLFFNITLHKVPQKASRWFDFSKRRLLLVRGEKCPRAPTTRKWLRKKRRKVIMYKLCFSIANRQLMSVSLYRKSSCRVSLRHLKWCFGQFQGSRSFWPSPELRANAAAVSFSNF